MKLIGKTLFQRLLLPAGLLALVSGCASFSGPPKPISESDHRAEIESLMTGEIGKVDDKAVDEYLKTVTELERQPKNRMKLLRAKIPKEVDARVRWWIHYYAGREHVLFQRMLDRGEQYRPMIREQLEHNLMPPELYYLAMIESGFVTRAESEADASGIWQLMEATGTHYGLYVDASVDERNHPVLATQAAIKYLQVLRKRFKSWYLVMAAYNAGPERIAKAIRRGKSNDFWVLVRKHALPEETMDYIPKFMAAVIVASHCEKFGFRKPKTDYTFPHLVPVKVKPRATLAELSQTGQIDLKTLKRFNPHLNYGTVPLQGSRAQIWVPATQAEAFRLALAGGPPKKKKRIVAAK